MAARADMVDQCLAALEHQFRAEIEANAAALADFVNRWIIATSE